MKLQKLQQVIKEEYVDVILNKRIDEAIIKLNSEEMDKLHSDGSVSVGEDTVTYAEVTSEGEVNESRGVMNYVKNAIEDLMFDGDVSEKEAAMELVTAIADEYKFKAKIREGKLTEDRKAKEYLASIKDKDERERERKRMYGEGKLTEASEISKLIKIGTKVSVNMGEDKLYKYAMKFERWNADNDDEYDDLVNPLFMGVELLQDQAHQEARAWLKQFNKACVKALKGLKESVVTEAKGWNDVAKVMDKALKTKKVPIKYAKDYVQSLERMAKRDPKQFFADYGGFTEDDFIEDLEYNMANEGKLTEAKPTNVTKQMWAKMSEYQKMDALLTVMKDPSKAEKFLDKKWNQLPSGFERDMMTENSLAHPEAKKQFNKLVKKYFKSIKEANSRYSPGTVLNEGDEYVIIDPRGNSRPTGNRTQASQAVKKMGGAKKGYYMVLKKNALKARRAIEKSGGNYNSTKVQDQMSDLYYEAYEPIDRASIQHLALDYLQATKALDDPLAIRKPFQAWLKTLKTSYNNKQAAEEINNLVKSANLTSKINKSAHTKWMKSMLKEGLWANINAKKKRGGKSAPKGSKAYKAAKKAGDKLEKTKESVSTSGSKLREMIYTELFSELKNKSNRSI